MVFVAKRFLLKSLIKNICLVEFLLKSLFEIRKFIDEFVWSYCPGNLQIHSMVFVVNRYTYLRICWVVKKRMVGRSVGLRLQKKKSQMGRTFYHENH